MDSTTPKEEIKKEWIKALRSGKYDQTTRYLHDSEGFCCLGVLCDLAVKAKVCRLPDFDENTYHYGNEREFEILPEEVRIWAGLSSDSGEFEDRDDCSASLAELNDDGRTFSEIADVIEKTRSIFNY